MKTTVDFLPLIVVLFLITSILSSVNCWEYPNTFPPPRPFGKGCPKTVEDPTLCALVWYDRYCRTNPWQLEPGDAFPNLGIEWNDRIIVAVIKENCILNIFEDTGFHGRQDSLQRSGFNQIRTVGRNGSYQMIGVSSMSCSCFEK
ncbi:hypothetical protein FO519_002597 [Halicephalobus sp. NKZ332]|nr:hypothetical protein FO519_002597 [Halicephalobus sp. NKZ332]